MTEAERQVRHYFQVKSRQLRESARLAAPHHKGLAGSHREELQRVYFSEILPSRYRVGRGLVYGLLHRSREADIVIWDAVNYPSLPLSDHTFFFAESVRVVAESKTRWSKRDFRDVLSKTKAVRDIVAHHAPNLDDAIAMLQLEVAALKRWSAHDGILRASPHIGTAAIFLSGGSGRALAPRECLDIADDIDDEWPDLVLLLETGRLVIKEYAEHSGQLLFFDFGADALLMFTNALLRLLNDRSVAIEAPLYLEQYMIELLDQEPFDVIEFSPSRWVPGRTPLWRT